MAEAWLTAGIIVLVWLVDAHPQYTLGASQG